MSKRNLYTGLSTFLRWRSLPSMLNSSEIHSSLKINSLRSGSTTHRFRSYEDSSVPTVRFSGQVSYSNASEKVGLRCWNCDVVHQGGPFLVCHSCRTIQPVDKSVDYFQIFCLEKYNVEDAKLEGKYKDWQKKLHPDLVHSKSEKEREYASEQCARVIDAVRTLTNPLLRAIYMMKLEGIEVDQEQTITEPELLAEIMEIREVVEEASEAKALNEILSQMQAKMKELSNSFPNAFQSRDFEEAKNCIRRMTYYDKVIEEIVKKL